MVLWIVFAVLTGLAILAVLVPLTRATTRVSEPDRSDRDSDIAVYKDQLREVEADLERGVVNADEAEAARAELGRRLLAADRQARTLGGAASLARPVAVAVILLVPLFSLGAYLTLGSPNMPGQPLAARMDVSPGTSPGGTPQGQDIGGLVAQVERHLAAQPEDGEGWEVIAPVYMRMGRFADATRAYANAVRLLGSTAPREANLGEARVALANGLVTADARAAFERALALDPADPKSRYFVALAARQDGETNKAERAWQALLAESPADAPWRPLVVQRLAELGVEPESAGINNRDLDSRGLDSRGLDSPAPRGPSAEDMAAAAQMSAEDRAAMIAGMVQGLADRLAEDGSDLDGWLRLARAYVVMGEPDKARQALSSARENFPGDTEEGARIDDTAKTLGLDQS